MDFLSIDGFECAGHVGEHDITNFVLLRRAAQSLSTPFIASGGLADGQGLAGALALGACGINMGTRFMCTVESPIHINIKKAIVGASEDDTELLLRRWRNTSRLFKNKVAIEAKKVEVESVTGKFEEIAPFVSGKRGRQVFITGDVDEGVSLPPLFHAHANLTHGFFVHRSGPLARLWASSTIYQPAKISWQGSRRRPKTPSTASAG